MAIEKKLLHFKKYSDFNSKKLSANVANTQYTLGVDGAVTSGEPDVKYQSICWIKDVQKIWTHGTTYNCADLISGTNIKTINGESVLGNGDIVIDANVLAVDDEYSTIIDADINKYIVETTDDDITLANNTYYRKTNISSNISISFDSPEDTTIFTNYSIEFTTSDTGTTITLPDTVKWLNGNAPSLENNITYQISVMNNLGVCAKYA